ncbi:hypothetical protein PG995_009845 [Apiospora arundinis]|uniref:Uncharacterized protein n=1 Tax=Apiospora arundinis TaxID=335852 RepID=A0ABR2JM93_9PEZI
MDPMGEIQFLSGCFELAKMAWNARTNPTTIAKIEETEHQRPWLLLPWVSRGRGIGRDWAKEDFERETVSFQARNRDLPPYVEMRDARGDIVPDGTRMMRDALQEAMLEPLSDGMRETGDMADWDLL